MNVCIFGASSDKIDKVYLDETFALSKKLAEAGNTLVYGAGSTGVMGAAAEGFTAGGGDIVGVIPEFFKDIDIEPIYPKCTELIFTKTMGERKKIMEDRSDVYLVFPGGGGTYEEFFEVYSLKRLSQSDKKIVIYNINHYYDPLIALLKHTVDTGFMTAESLDMYLETDDPNEVIEYIK